MNTGCNSKQTTCLCRDTGRFRESYFKLKVNGRAMTSQTDKQPNVEVGSVLVSTAQPTWKHFQFEPPGMKLLFSSWAFSSLFPPCYFIFLEPC